jgi:hypothetical protein
VPFTPTLGEQVEEALTRLSKHDHDGARRTLAALLRAGNP